MTQALAIRDDSAALAVNESTRQLVEASIAPNTKRAYESALRKLYAAIPGPLNDMSLADYISRLHEDGKSPATISLAVAAVRFRHKDIVGPITSRALAGIRREGQSRGRGQVAGVRWEQADAAAIISESDGTISGLRDAAIIAVMSDALLRVSELASLDVADVNLDEQTVTIRRSKTDQNAEGSVQFLGEPTCNRIRTYLQAANITEGPLFVRVRRGDVVVKGSRLDNSSVRRIIASRCGVVAGEGRVSGHSLRVGSAQSLASAGASLVEMQTAGRWSSPSMPGRYARGQLAARGAVARLRYSTS